MNTDTIKLNRGMNNNGGAYFCQNIRPSLNDGVFAGISMDNISVRTSGTTTATMGRMVNFTQVGESVAGFLPVSFSKDTNGDLYFYPYSGDFIKINDYSLDAESSRGLMVDTNGTVVYTGSQYIGREYNTTLDGAIDASANAIDLIDASNFPAAGYAFVIENSVPLKPEVIQWTGKTSNQLTGVTRGKLNTTASSHITGSTVYYFKDQWIDLGESLTSSTRQCIKWEDENFFVNGNIISGYKLEDGSDFATKLELSTDKIIIDLGLLQTSATSYILVGANSGENGYIYVWDGKDTQTISERELKNNNITRIWDNFIATDNGIYQYDGTNLELIVQPLENDNLLSGGTMDVRDMKIIKNYLLYTTGSGYQNRNRGGLWYVDLTSGDRYYVLPSNYNYHNINFGAIFPTSSKILVSSDYLGGSVDIIREAPKSRGSIYQFLYNPTNSKVLQLKRLRINLSIDTKTVLDQIISPSTANANFEIIVRGYDFTKPFIRRSQLKSGETPTGSNQFIIVDTLGVPSVGDRVEIVGRIGTNNSAMAPRNITSIVAGTGKYTITVDEDFPYAIGAAEQNSSADVVFNPLKRIGSIKVENTAINLQGYDIPLLNQPMFKKMLFEIEVRCTSTNISPELNSLEVNYEILE